MKKLIITVLILLCNLIVAQNKKIKKVQNRDKEIVQNVFSDFENMEKAKLLKIKDELNKSQRKLKIEIINEGETEQLNQMIWLKINKVNDQKFEQAIKTDSTTLEIKTNFDESIWKDESGGILFEGYNPLKISQEYFSKKNDESINQTDIQNKEVYETTIPVYSFSLKISTHRKDYNALANTNFSKTINIYSDDKLIKTYTFSYEELRKLEGIKILDFKLDYHPN